MPRSSHKHFVIQGIILTMWVLLMVLAHGTVNVESQFLCPDYKFLTPNPGWSWRPNKTITVSIDQEWNDLDRFAIIDGNIKWNSWNGGNCSGVKFVGFTPRTYTAPEYADHPPDDNLYWQRTDPDNGGFAGGVFQKFDLFFRVKAARIKIDPALQNGISSTHYIWLGAHEVGHLFNLQDCLCDNKCDRQCKGQISVMSGQGSISFNTSVPTTCDQSIVDLLYCPFIAGTPEDCEIQGMYWNYFEETCESTPQECPGFCNEEGGIDKDPCRYATGCPPGYEGSPLRTSQCCFAAPTCPIAVDLDGTGFHFTNAVDGVSFDIDGDGKVEQISWTQGASRNAWLVLDRNGNGVVDNGTELFGNYTVQPVPPFGEERNGFLALAEFDKTTNGGNGDKMIDRRDAIFSALRLWQDANQNGISEASELNTLPWFGLTTVELSYKDSRRSDEYGNQFRYRAKVKDSRGEQVGRWAWDVFLVKTR